MEALNVTDLLMYGTVGAIALAVFMLVRSLYPADLIDEVREQASRARVDEQGRAIGDAPARPGRVRAFGLAFVHKLGNYNQALVKPKFADNMRRKFIAMGRPEYRPQDFIAQQQIWAVFFLVVGLLALNLLGRPLWYALPFGVFGYLFPYIWLREQITKRQAAIGRALPYHIDLLTLSVEAGLDFQQALGTVVEKGQSGPLMEELALVLSEIRLGKTRAEALRNFADRVQIAEVSAFVANLVQADRMGTSIGKVLRIQSTQMRVARTHRAEKLANEAPIKMLLPLVACIFPTVFLVLFGPIVYRLMYGG